MNKPLLPCLLLTVSLLSGSLALSATVRAADATTPTPPPAAAHEGKHDGMKGAFAQLDLTEAQKQQMTQIRQSTTDRKARREQMMAILTPEQKAKLEKIRAQHNQAGATQNK